MQLVLSDVDEELLGDSIAFHVLLNDCCMVIFVLLNDRYDIELFSSSVSVLNALCSSYTRLLLLQKLVFCNELSCKSLDADG